MSGFLAVGNMSIDDLVFADGTTMWHTPGGNAIYAALGMAVWGARPAVLAVHGEDYPVAMLADRIDLSPARRHRVTLRNWGLYEEDGTRQFIFRHDTRDWIEFCPDVADLHGVTAAFCHLAPLPFGRQVALARAARAGGARLLSVDPDDREIRHVDAAALAALLDMIDAFLPSRQEMRALFPGSGPVAALRRLRRLAPRTPVIGVKCGAEGVLLHLAAAAELVMLPSVVAVAVDATGAGDAFCGGFLVGLARTADPVMAAAMGSVSAAFAVGAVGTTALVGASLAQAETMLAALLPRITRKTFLATD